MNTHALSIFVVVALLLGGAGYALTQQGKKEYGEKDALIDNAEPADIVQDDTVINNEVEKGMMDKEDSVMKKDTMDTADDKATKDEVMKDVEMKKDDTVSGGAGETVPMVQGTYEAYSPEKLARAESGKVVLFFKASWCPTCRALDSDIKNNLGAIPDGVSILELNFDTETELRKRYGVTTQHTLVQVNATGEQITKWSGGNTLASVLARVQ